MMLRFIVLFLFAALAPVKASELTCLSPDEARRAVSGQKLISIDQAARLARTRAGGEMISAQLCRIDNRLVYDIGILASGGKVARIGVDAASSTVKILR